LRSTHANITSTGEEFSETVERAGHDTIGGVESLLDTVAMVDVDIDVENTRVDTKQLENTENAAKLAEPICHQTHMSFT